MKSYKEMTESVIKRRDEYNISVRNRNRRIGIVSSSAAGIALVAIIGTVALTKGSDNAPEYSLPTSETTHPSAQYSENADIANSETLSDIISEPATDDQVVISPHIVINPITDADKNERQEMYIALMGDDFIEMSRTEVCEYYGMNVFPEVPSDLVCWDESKGYSYGIFKRENGKGETYHDQNDITYSNEDVSKSINIKVARGKLPFTCFMFHMKDEMKASEINGIEVYIGQHTDMTEVYYAEFMYNNTGFYVFTDGLTEDETVAVIASLIQ